MRIPNKFWFGYVSFFVFIFPLFFSYMGLWGWGPIGATISLVVGFVGWILFIRWLIQLYYVKPKKIIWNLKRLLRDGQLTTAQILDKTQIQPDDPHALLLDIEFPNLVGTVINTQTEVYDSRPEQRRFEPGKTLRLRLNTDAHVPPFVPDDTTPTWTYEWKKTTLVIIVIVLYAVLTFMGHYYFYSDGKGWRFLTIYHPWVGTPYLAMVLYSWYFRVMEGRIFGGADEEKLGQFILYGNRTTAVLEHVAQTGLQINEQPQMRLRLAYEDQRGATQTASLKQVVMLHELAKFNEGSRHEILYLPEQPEKILIL